MRKGNRQIDLTGQRFNRLVVIEETKDRSSVGGKYWDCKCDCGETKSYRSDVLRKTNIQSCGCASGNVKLGQTVGSLKVVERLGKIRGKRSLWWKCQCDCGKFIELTSYSVKGGYHKSCGCLGNPNGKKHPNYIGYEEMSGGFFSRIEKGAITRNVSFKITKKQIWDLFEKQNRKCALSGVDIQFGVNSRIKEKKRECTASLDRIDNAKGYVKGNIQWIHKDVNKMKNTHTQEEFIKICKLIAVKC